MPRPKPNPDDYKHLFEGMKYRIVSTGNFNVNTKIIISCEYGHEYITSITKIKSLCHNYKQCPHCIKKENFEKKGIPVSKIEQYCSNNNLTFYPKKDFYNRWKDAIVFECKNGHKHEVKSLSYWENNAIENKFVCAECEIQSLGLMSDDSLNEYLSNYNPVKVETANILPSFDVCNLPESLRQKMEGQSKWRIINYTNARTKATYQCVDCGETKVCNPHNLFGPKGYGCLNCNKIRSLKKKAEKVIEVCKLNNIVIINNNNSNFSFKCNNCGMEFAKECVICDYDTYNITCPSCYKSTKRKSQIQLENYIKSLGIHTVSEHKEFGVELDIFIPSHKTAIEYCGLVWHSTKYKNDRNCHLNKLKVCESHGVKLLTIFEDEWIQKQDICKSRINHILGMNSKRIFGRKCEVSFIDNKTALQFCEDNHIQGRGQSNQSVGLFDNSELVGVMTFSKPSTAKSAGGYDWELNRFCNKVNTYVVGGADKMLQHFIKSNTGITLVSFADKRWSTGNVYDKLGFVKEKETAPNYYYFGKNTKYKRLHRFNFTKSKIMSLMGLKNTPLSETDLAKAYGLFRIYDCGHIKYIMKT